MKFDLILVVALLTSAAAAITVPRSGSLLESVPQDHPLNTTDIFDVSNDWSELVTVAANNEQIWTSNVARGRKLLAAMKGTDAEAANIWNMGESAKSAFDGDLKNEMKAWGWNDNPDKQKKELDKQCDFATYHKIARSFEELGMGTQSKGSGGPNECFIAEHWDGPLIKKNLLGKLPKPKDQKYKACDGLKYQVRFAYEISSNASVLTTIRSLWATTVSALTQ